MEKRVAEVEKVRSAIKTVVAVLDKDRSAPSDEDEQDATGGAPGDRRAKRSSSTLDAISHPVITLTFENVLSKPVLVGRSDGPGIGLSLSLYEVHDALRAFDKPLHQHSKNIKKFRTQAVDDPILMNMGQIVKGTAWIRYAALLLEQSVDRFAADFTRKLSRDKLVSAFVNAICPENAEEVMSSKAINAICLPRRKLLREDGDR
jgi:hypothetical protein